IMGAEVPSLQSPRGPDLQGGSPEGGRRQGGRPDPRRGLGHRSDDRRAVSEEFLAFDFGGTRARCALVSREGRMGPPRVLPRPPSDDGPRWLARMLEAARGLLAVAPGAPRAGGVSVGGPGGDEGGVFSLPVA